MFYQLSHKGSLSLRQILLIQAISYISDRFSTNWVIWDNAKCPNIQIISVPVKEDKKKGHEKILEKIIMENFYKMGKERATQFQENQTVSSRINPKQNTGIHILIKLIKSNTRVNIKSNKGKATNNTQGDTHKDNSWSSIEILQSIRETEDILKVMKRKTYNKITLPRKDLIQIWRKNPKLYRQAKAERFQHHQTSSSANAKGSFLDRKHRKGL